MAGNPRDHVKGKGFWDGGASGHGTNKEAAGRPSGLPGTRKPRRVGINTDLDFPPAEQAGKNEPKK
jgi:hypothetical protein